ncbi:DUF418 domain-containing protein [Flavobacterium sp. M31R6]|uniref:DUF418 domain-containing protein n=1 Tax=Flavobacterium sp. M31R6 TaxID=2739062 RepID=UPI00156938AF|nr:DUF418 domain-containing protein [Flavobacterium sp. M31R6]QKJ61909.1 DUF418 domain-containing protein [Flavobacterium sp. M31R6]
MNNTYKPIEDNKRTTIVDILRGWALLGVVIGNYVDYKFIGLPSDSNAKNIVTTILGNIHQYVFAAKSWTLLSVLFGYGFAVLIQNVESKGKNPVGFFAWRMLILFVLAFVNSAIWLGDILKDYAFLGLILLLFYKCSAKTILRVSLFLLLTIPLISGYVNTLKYVVPDVYSDPKHLQLYHSSNWFDVFEYNLLGTYYGQMLNLTYAITVHIMMFTCMLLGFYAQKTDFFTRLPELKKTLKKTFFISLAIALLLISVFEIVFSKDLVFPTYFRPGYWLVLSTMFSIATGICILYNHNKLQTLFAYFRLSGKMTLTNYVVQNLLATVIFSGIGLKLYNTMPFWFYYILAVSVFIIQLFVSKWWLSKFNYGPVEWLWRVLSYKQLFAFKKIATESIPKESDAVVKEQETVVVEL